MVKVEVLGTGCRKCKKLYEEARKAIEASGVEAELVKVEDLDAIMDHGVMLTPALVVSGQVKSSGRVPTSKQIVPWLTELGG